MARRSKSYFVLLVCVMTLLSVGVEAGTERGLTLTAAVEKARNGQTSADRYDGAEQVVKAIGGIRISEIDEATITAIGDLLDVPEARPYAAVALARLRPRSRLAIPKLKTALAEEECSLEPRSAYTEILIALKKLGVAVPLPDCKARIEAMWTLAKEGSPGDLNGYYLKLANQMRRAGNAPFRERLATDLQKMSQMLALYGTASRVNDESISALIQLLDIPEMPVRVSVADSLAVFGIRAHAAAPALRKMLDEVRCQGRSGEQSFRHALRTIGDDEPDTGCKN